MGYNSPVTTALSRGPAGSFLPLAIRYLEEYEEKIRYGTSRLDANELWWRPAERMSSVGNLLLHLNGNLSLWVLKSLGGETYERDRDGEFAARGGATAEELLERLSATIKRCCEIFRELNDERLQQIQNVQGYEVDGIGIVFHAVEHMSYHSGQILALVKQQLDENDSLELYPRHAGE